MNHKFVVISLLSLLAVPSVHAASYTVVTHSQTDSQIVSETIGPVSAGLISSTSINVEGNAFNWDDPASAQAYANENGQTGVSVEGMFACGSCNFRMFSESYYGLSYVNTTSSSINFTYDFFINGPRVEISDYAGIDQSSGLGASANASVFMQTSGGLNDSLSVMAQLEGGRLGHDFYQYGSTATYFTNDVNGFGYQLADVYGSFSGILGAGETLTIDTDLWAEIRGPGWELGAKASVGDPNNLSVGGILGELHVTAVPVPAAAWLFATGLIGLLGVARRKS